MGGKKTIGRDDVMYTAKDRRWGTATFKGRGEVASWRQRRNRKQCPGSQRRRGFEEFSSMRKHCSSLFNGSD